MKPTKNSLLLVTVLVLATALRLYLANREIFGDKIYFIDAAQHILSTGYPFYNDGTPGTLLFAFWHPPLYFFAVAFALLFQGLLGVELAVRMIGVVCGVVSVWMIYVLGKKLFGLRAAFAAAFVAAVNPFFIEGNQTVDIDGTLLTVLLLASALVYYSYLESGSSKRLLVSASLFGLALLSKEAAFVMLPSMLVLHYVHRGFEWRKMAIFASVAIGMFCLGLLYMASYSPAEIANYVNLLLSRVHGVGSPGGKGISYLDLFGPVGSIGAVMWEMTPPVAALFAIGVLSLLRRPRSKDVLFLVAWSLSFVVFFSVAGKIDKYYLAFLPAVFLLSGVALDNLGLLEMSLPRSAAALAAAGALGLGYSYIPFQETYGFISSHLVVVSVFVIPALVPVAATMVRRSNGRRAKGARAILAVAMFAVIIAGSLYFTAVTLPLDQIGARQAGMYIQANFPGAGPIVSSKDIAFYAGMTYYEINYFTPQTFGPFLSNHTDVRVVSFYGSTDPLSGFSSTQYWQAYQQYLVQNHWTLSESFSINYKGTVFVYERA